MNAAIEWLVVYNTSFSICRDKKNRKFQLSKMIYMKNGRLNNRSCSIRFTSYKQSKCSSNSHWLKYLYFIENSYCRKEASIKIRCEKDIELNPPHSFDGIQI